MRRSLTAVGVLALVAGCDAPQSTTPRSDARPALGTTESAAAELDAEADALVRNVEERAEALDATADARRATLASDGADAASDVAAPAPAGR